MKRCVLCQSMARVYCDSDRANLCWTCDAKVHSANFLVARHSRSLLCRVCQSPTPWTASGEKLLPSAASSCGRCVVGAVSDVEEGVGGNNGETDNANVVEIGNQPLPRSSTQLPPAASSSSSDEFLAREGAGLRKRKHENVAEISPEDEIDSSAVNIKHERPSSTMPKQAIEDETGSFASTVSSSVGIVGDMKKLGDRNIISGEYMHASHLRGVKSRRTAEFDLNLLAVE